MREEIISFIRLWPWMDFLENAMTVSTYSGSVFLAINHFKKNAIAEGLCIGSVVTIVLSFMLYFAWILHFNGPAS